MWIPEGTSVTVAPYVLHRHPAYFSPDPDTFWPERWLHASSAKRTPKQFAAATAIAADLSANVGLSKVEPGNVAQSDSGEVRMNAAAFIPFSYGPANCAGRNLALVEMRMVVALLIQRFDMTFAAGYNPGSWNKAIKDWFVVKVGELPVTLTPRI